MQRRGWTVVAGAVVVLFLSITMARMPVPYVALAPGSAVNTLGSVEGTEVISVEGADVQETSGALDLVTVAVYDGFDLITALRFWLDSEIAVVPRSVVYPPGESTDDVEAESKAQWTQSQSSAEVVALRELGYPIRVTVAGVDDDSDAQGKLEPGDVITAVNGTQVETAAQLVEMIREMSPGDTVTIAFERDDRAAQATVDVQAADDAKDKGAVGVSITTEPPEGMDFEFGVDGIGGPSAGLMFTLAIIDKLDTVDLTGGLTIAGTGTMSATGTVGAIGGVQQKVVVADNVEADAFLTPAGNCTAAKQAAPEGLRLVKVESIDDALNALETLRSGSGELTLC